MAACVQIASAAAIKAQAWKGLDQPLMPRLQLYQLHFEHCRFTLASTRTPCVYVAPERNFTRTALLTRICIVCQ
jgi:hypothetical protein